MIKWLGIDCVKILFQKLKRAIQRKGKREWSPVIFQGKGYKGPDQTCLIELKISKKIVNYYKKKVIIKGRSDYNRHIF